MDDFGGLADFAGAFRFNPAGTRRASRQEPFEDSRRASRPSSNRRGGRQSSRPQSGHPHDATAPPATALNQHKANAGTEPVMSPPTVPAYCARKEPAHAHTSYKPSGQEMMWQKHPARACELHPMEAFPFQALQSRASPHVYEGAAERWPASGFATGHGTVHPLDGRKHAHWFGYREMRSTRMLTRQTAPEEGGEVLTVQLDIVKQVLTSKYGSLKAAFQALDFFQDQRLSPIEWQEGLTRAFCTYSGPSAADCRRMVERTQLFHKRLREIFYEIDENRDGLISFEELSAPRLSPTESSHDFTRRREAELYGTLGKSASSPDLRSTFPSWSKQTAAADYAESEDGPAADGRPGCKRDVKTDPSDRLRDFAALLMRRFPNVEVAFKVLDIHKSEQLTLGDFVTGCRTKLKYTGDARAIFQELDADGSNTLSCDELVALRGLPPAPAAGSAPSKKDIVAERRARDPIAGPSPHKRGISVAGSSHNPLTERMAGGSGFHSFGREPTGRLDDLIHPEELPGVDRDFFHAATGPGLYERGPEAYNIAELHPSEGSKWKQGGNMNRIERFGPTMPSKQARDDVELASGRYMRYEGRAPEDLYKSAGVDTGKTAMLQTSLRRGPTMGSSDDPGLKTPTPIGKWGDTRTTLHLKTRSEPSLLKQVMH